MKKIVILSFQRNATQSLSDLLSRNGIHGIHHIITRENHDVFRDKNLKQIQEYIEKYEIEYALFSDAPYFMMYEYFDKKYPESMFILVTREENEWLTSFKTLYSKGQTDAVSLACYREYLPKVNTYNILEVLDEDLLYMYNKHNKDVLDYFKDRKNFIHLDISEINSTEKLYNFLKIDKSIKISNIDYSRNLKVIV